MIAYKTRGVWEGNRPADKSIDMPIDDERLYRHDIITLPRFPRRFTQRNLAHWIMSYEENFENVNIDKIDYNNIPQRMMEGTGLDSSKLVISA